MKNPLPLSVPSFAARLSHTQAQRLHLLSQGMLTTARKRARKADVVAAIERMRLLQIDTIHVVARSPYLVLHSRLGHYQQAWLDEALEQGRIAETWAHEACFVPAADVALHRAWRLRRDGHWAHKHAARMDSEQREGMDALLARMRESGPVRASDFSREDKGASGWWSWKPEKRWLEALFARGEVMVTRRERFQRIYDLSERVLAKLHPAFDVAQESIDEVSLRRHFILDTVRALGITQSRWIADYFRLRPAVTDAELAPLVEEGRLLRVDVDGWGVPGYVHPDWRDELTRASKGLLRATRTALLSPFDPLVWDRARALGMFGFEYTIECYVPEAKRKFGYYVLPILHRGRLVGRLDAKAHRSTGEFEVKRFFLEPDVKATDAMLEDIAAAVAETAQWHGTPAVRLRQARPTHVAAPLRALLR
uniref:winged helix-turn-helix domain-containing protein n=1 Tax=Dyella soli TaxID=522319 RepID=UPI0030B84FA2